MKNVALSILFIITLAFNQEVSDEIKDIEDVSPADSAVTSLEEEEPKPAAEEKDIEEGEWETVKEEKKLSTSEGVTIDDDTITLAVLDFGGQNVDSTVTIPLADRFRSELLKTEKYAVMERNEMHKVLEEQNFQRSECVDQTCAVEAGQLIAVKKIVTGTVAKIGGIYTVNTKMLDVATGRIDKNISEDCDCPIERLLTETMQRIAYKMAGLEVEEKKVEIDVQRGDATLFVKTEPEDASVYLDGKLMDGRTPCKLENLTPGKHTVLVKKADLRANKSVELKGNEMTRITLKLEKQKTALNISTNPTEAELFLDAKRTLSKKPNQKTPAIFYDIPPGAHQFSLFKVGFADTTLSIDIKEFEKNNFNINLKKLTDDQQILKQKKFVKNRLQRKVGRVMIFGSIGIAAGGGVMIFLAQRDYDDALDSKKTLEKSSITSGPEYDKLVKENKDKSEDGDLKTYISIGLFGAAGACGGLGIIFFF